ncbi:MAG: DUF6516 family protein [Sulfuritalea sp.]|jgi:hypothetical protein|nr:DUF6516 family protein [Sulfuritalea sp.]
MLANIRATPIYRHRVDFDDGAILEIVVWRLPTPIEGCSHSFKYRLFYGSAGKRLIGYDNERPKGDHRHNDDREELYSFESPEKLIDDFLRDVEDRRAGR